MSRFPFIHSVFGLTAFEGLRLSALCMNQCGSVENVSQG